MLQHGFVRMAGSLLGLAAAPAFAQPLVVDNHAGTFHWATEKTFWSSGIAQQVAFLDVTQPASQASAVSGPRFDSRVLWPEANTRGGGFVFEGSNNATIATSGSFSPGGQGFAGQATVPIALALHAGDSVGSGLTFGIQAIAQYLTDPSHTTQPDTVLFSGPAYIGVTLTLNDGLHYGWIEIQPETPADLSQGNVTTEYYAPIAWAYESTPNTAITIPAPEPASLALSVLAVPLLLRRRR